MSETEIPFDHRVLIGAAAVSEGAPAGADPRGGEEFEELETELRRMETDGPAAVNWRRVIERSSSILGKRGKDLLIGVWLAYALTREERHHGLATGLGIIRGMVAEHWDAMQPPVARERARVGALEWLVGRVAPLLEGEVSESDWPAVLYAYDQLGEIDNLTSQKLRKEQVAYGDLLRALRPHRDTARRGQEEAAQKRAQAEAEAKAREGQAAQQAAAPAPEPTPAAAPTTSAATSAVAPAQAAPAAATALDLASLDQLPEALRSLSAAMIARSTADPGAYLLARIGSWWRIRQLPPNEGGRTGAMPPVEEFAAVTALRASGQNAEALRALNDLVWTAPFWFEGHRLTAEILGSLGPEHAAARATVAGAMSLLLTRFPELLDLSFNDGKPFVDPATRSWIEASGGGGGRSADQGDGIDRALGEARALVADGKAPDALELLANLTRGEIGGRVRLVRQIAQARFCLDVGLVGAALPLLDHLEAMLKAHDLESWEPALAVQVAELRFRALTHSDAPRLMLEERRRSALEETRLRLVRLDLAAAARLFR